MTPAIIEPRKRRSRVCGCANARRWYWAAIVALALFGAVGVRAQPATAPTTQPAAATSQLTATDAEAYLAHVRYLADDERAGRFVGSEGSLSAARYIVSQLEAAGCEPAGARGTWFQPFEVDAGQKLVDDQAELRIVGLARKWAFRKDWITFPFSTAGEIRGPLAFAGYGIHAPEHDWNDYEGFDATGKILLIFRYEPRIDESDEAFEGADHSQHALFSRKVSLAAARGALGLLIVDPPLDAGKPLPDQGLFVFNQAQSRRPFALPVAHVSRELANAITEGAGLGSLVDLQRRLDQKREPLGTTFEYRVVLRPGLAPHRLRARNVVGRLSAASPQDAVIVVGAHYDHLKPRKPGGDAPPIIFNGADDNASGVAAVLEVARELREDPPRSCDVLFVAFDAEEVGLLGSWHFVRHPVVPREQIRAMINFDMVGRPEDDELIVFGADTAPGLRNLIDQSAATFDIPALLPLPLPGNSDHYPFYANGIPALLVHTGLHPQYHHPDDDWQRIDAAGGARISRMFAAVTRQLAARSADLTFAAITGDRPVPDEFAEKRPAQNLALAPEHSAGAATRDDLLRFGILPDLDPEDATGLLLLEVLPGGPADIGGVRAGDQIVKIGPDVVRDFADYQAVLRTLSPGDKVPVVIRRDGKPQTLTLHIPERAR